MLKDVMLQKARLACHSAIDGHASGSFMDPRREGVPCSRFRSALGDGTAVRLWSPFGSMQGPCSKPWAVA